MKISVNSKVRLNGVGIFGAILFVGGPMLAALSYWRIIEITSLAARYSLPATGLDSQLRAIAIASAASLVGFVMLLIGREYEHTVEINKDQPPQA